MNDYEILSLMDTHKIMKQQGLDVPDVFVDFLSGVVPLDEPELGDATPDVNELLDEEDLANAITSAVGTEEESPSLEAPVINEQQQQQQPELGALAQAAQTAAYISDEDVDEIEE